MRLTSGRWHAAVRRLSGDARCLDLNPSQQPSQAFPDEFKDSLHGFISFQNDDKQKYERIWFILGRYDSFEYKTIMHCWNACRTYETSQNGAELPMSYYPQEISGGEWIPTEFRDLFKVDMWKNVIAKDAACMSICFFELDHIFPRSRGGKSARENLAMIHWNANRKKSNKLIPFLSPKEKKDLQTGLSLDQFLALTVCVEEIFDHRDQGYELLKKMLIEHFNWPKNFWRKLKALVTGRDLWMYILQHSQQCVRVVQVKHP